MASFVEEATLLLNDKASKNISKVNRELKQLFATTKKMSNMKLDLRGLDKAAGQAKKATSAIQALNREVSKARKPVTINVKANTSAATNALNRLSRNRTATINAAVNGTGGMFSPRMGYRFGQQIGFGFNASIGHEVWQGLRAAGRSVGRGVLGIDDARTDARAQGIDVAALEASAQRAAERTVGVSAADIMVSSLEQAGNLQQQLREGRISAAQYASALEGVTKSIAEGAQIYGSVTHDFAKATEMARNEQKALALLGDFSPEDRKKTTDALRQAMLATGGDVPPEEIVRKLRQVPGSVRLEWSAEGLAAFALAIDDGGARAAANIRTAYQDLYRGNLNDKDMQRQIAFGLRDAQGNSLLTVAEQRNPMVLALERLIPAMKQAGVDINNGLAVASYLDNVVGFDTTGAKYFAEVIPRIDQNQLEIRKTQNMRPERYLETPTLRAHLTEVNTALQDAAGKMLTPLIPPLKEGVSAVSKAIEAVGNGQMPTGGDAAALAGVAATAAVATMAAGPLASLTGLEALTTGTGQERLLGAIAVNTGNTAAGVAALAAGSAIDDIGGSSFWKRLLKWGPPAAIGIGIAEGTRRVVSEFSSSYAEDMRKVATHRSSEESSMAAYIRQQSQINSELEGLAPLTRAALAERGLETLSDKRSGYDLLDMTARKAATSVDALAAASASAAKNPEAFAIDALNQRSDETRWRQGLEAARAIEAINSALSSGTLTGASAERATAQLSELRMFLDAVGQTNWKQALPETGAAPVPFGRDAADPNTFADGALVALDQSITNSVATFDAAFGTGSQKIADAGVQAGTSISTGHSSGATQAAAMIQQAHATGGQLAAAAIKSAAASIKVTVGGMPNGPAPANTGATGGAL